jgi:hypothetical protein
VAEGPAHRRDYFAGALLSVELGVELELFSCFLDFVPASPAPP